MRTCVGDELHCNPKLLFSFLHLFPHSLLVGVSALARRLPASLFCVQKGGRKRSTAARTFALAEREREPQTKRLLAPLLLSSLVLSGPGLQKCVATKMTEVLAANKPCTHAAHDMEFSPRESTAVNVDSDELIGSPGSPYAMESPVIVSPLVNLSCTSNCTPLSQRQHNREIAHGGRGHVELSVLALVIEALRRSGLTCQGSVDDISMEIGWPTNVRHVTHVTFDRFNGFLGLPVELQMEVPRRVPSASASVFGVSAESMQCSYDRKGNSVPTILLLLQERLYDQGGLKAEGVFRINAENGQEEFVRDQINHGIVPFGIDVHCLAGLIKAWFRELPRGVLDSLSPEQVMQCNTEEQALALVKTLPPMQGALLDWGINLMADVVQEEHFNKMNAHNIAMVFAPNMTQMSDPLTALMHAVQVMNLLKTLILRTLRDREEALLDPRPASSCTEPPTGNGHDNANKETPMGLSFANSNISSGPVFDKERIFLKSFDGKESIDDFESARTSEEILTTALHGLDFSFDAELSSDSHGLFSNGSSTVENTDDDSNGVSPSSRPRRKEVFGPLCSNADKSRPTVESCACSTAKSELFSNILGKIENFTLEGEDFVITEFLHCGSLEQPTPGQAKKKACAVGKIDQINERVEAW